MANLNIKNVYLLDLWPGAPVANLGIPTGGWDSTAAGNRSITPVYPIGTKIQAYQDSTKAPGWYTMIYLRQFEGTGQVPPTADLSNGYNFCTIGDATYAPDGTGCWWNVTSHATISCATHDFAPLAVACTSLEGDGTLTATADAAAQYGWFWCGGVCPLSECTAFAGVAGAGADVTIAATAISGLTFINDASQISLQCYTAGDGTCSCVGFSMASAA